MIKNYLYYTIPDDSTEYVDKVNILGIICDFTTKDNLLKNKLYYTI
jgi:hypothetical protein